MFHLMSNDGNSNKPLSMPEIREAIAAIGNPFLQHRSCINHLPHTQGTGPAYGKQRQVFFQTIPSPLLMLLG